MKNINKIFSYEKSETHKIFNLLGLRFKFRRTHQPIPSNSFKDTIQSLITNHWVCDGATDELMSLFKFMFNIGSFKNFDDYIWLVYTSCVLERDGKEAAMGVLKWYLAMFGPDKIELSLPLSNLANEMNIHTELIDKSAALFKRFEQNKGAVLALLKDKTVAIVGNGSGELGKKKGKDIDSHDIVVRFNDLYKQLGHEEDYGKKTNIWVMNGGTQNAYPEYRDFYLDLFNKLDAVYIKFDIWHNFCSPELYDLYSSMKNVKIIDTFNSVEEVNLMPKYTKRAMHVPTVGFLVVLLIYEKYQNFDNIDFYGFSFLEDTFSGTSHFYEDFNWNIDATEKMHNFSEEARVLKKLVLNKTFVEGE